MRPKTFNTVTYALFLLAIAITAHAQPASAPAPTLYVCGDSTAANGRERGWASHLQPFFDPAKLRVENRARGGLRGTGDESQDVTTPDGKQETVHTYGHYLRKFIADARAHGATPIVASPVVRNDWRDGKVIRSESYPVYSADVATSEKCLFVDASSIIADRYDKMGEAAVKPYFPEEHTHTSADGAKLNAELVVAGLKSLRGEPLNASLSDRGQEVPVYRPQK